MKITPNLVRWQREGYPRAHQSRLNLVLHLLTAPIFNLGFLLLLVSVFRRSFGGGLTGIGLMLFVLVVQGFGHSREANRPEPFRSPLDFVARFFVENTFNFWRFLFSGDYARAFRGPVR